MIVMPVKLPNTVENPLADYKKLVDTLNSENKEDVYEKLLQTEQNVLNVINRLANKEEQPKLFQEETLYKIFSNVAVTLRYMFVELFVRRDYKNMSDIMDILVTGERKIYTGLIVAFLALFLFFIEVLG
jgi:hypothetical protein